MNRIRRKINRGRKIVSARRRIRRHNLLSLQVGFSEMFTDSNNLTSPIINKHLLKGRLVEMKTLYQ